MAGSRWSASLASKDHYARSVAQGFQYQKPAAWKCTWDNYTLPIRAWTTNPSL